MTVTFNTGTVMGQSLRRIPRVPVIRRIDNEVGDDDVGDLRSETSRGKPRDSLTTCH